MFVLGALLKMPTRAVVFLSLISDSIFHTEPSLNTGNTLNSNTLQSSVTPLSLETTLGFSFK